MATAHPEAIDKFQILQALGEGGMGRLYLGRDPDIGRLVAIKLLREGFNTEEFRQRFVREAQSASALRHANIVTIFHAGTHTGHPFIVMEYIQGETLADLIARRRPMPLARKLQVMDEIATGLQYAHRKGVIHRDIKPANIMIDEDGVVRILDFGIARVHGSGLTQSGVVIGTLNYMAPEQLAGAPIDSRADIFAAGAVLYELLAYQRAFPGGFPEILQEIMTDAPTPLERLDPQLSPDVIAVVSRCLAKRAEDRYPDFGAVRAALATVPVETADSSVESTVLVPAMRGRGGRDGPGLLRSSDVRQRVDEARRAFEEVNYNRALEACQSALALDPECAEALDLEQRARAALQKQQFVNRWLADARLALDQGDTTAASVLVDRALSVSSESAEAQLVRQAVNEARRRWAESQAPRPAAQPAPAARAAPASRESSRRWRAGAVVAGLVLIGGAAVWRLPRDPGAALPESAGPSIEAPGGTAAGAVAARLAALRSAAREAWQRGELDAAMNNLGAAFALQPDDTETRSLIDGLVDEGRQRSARAAADARAKAGNDTPAFAAAVARESEAIRLQDLGQSVDAARAFVDAARLFSEAAAAGRPVPPPSPGRGGAPARAAPDPLAALLAEADALLQRRDYDAAIGRYADILKRAPQNGQAQAGLEQAQAARQSAEDALARLAGASSTPSAASSPQEAEAQRLVEAAIKAMDAGDDAAAQRALDEALRLNPRHAGAQKLLKVLTGR